MKVDSCISISKIHYHYGCKSAIVLISFLLICYVLNLAGASFVGRLNQEGSVDFDLLGQNASARNRTSRAPSRRPSGASGIKPARGHEQKTDSHMMTSGEQFRVNKLTIASRRNDEVLSTDCVTKRSEILNRQGVNIQHQQAQPSTRAPMLSTVSYQRLKPNIEQQSATGTTTAQAHQINDSQIHNNLDSEHVPRCNQDGGYESIQCHKIGYCWCVNKYGQAIKNTAVKAGEEPECDPSMYDNESNDSIVVTGVSSQSKEMLSNVSYFESTTANGNVDFEARETGTEPASYDANYQNSNGNEPRPRGPIMPLMPNNCRGSRDNARDRAEKFSNFSIWVPECDPSNESLYAEKQCHRSKVCWCVEQTTGLPLRGNEQLTSRSSDNDCKDLSGHIEVSSQPKVGEVFYLSSSEHCDSEKRLDFIISLSNQFRQQVNEYIRQNPASLNQLPSGISSTNPFAISEAQISKWKFTLMDRDNDGKLGDREWSKFKNNFKLVDRADELDNPYKQRRSPYSSLAPLLILRSQRKCWRDFLDFCDRGDLSIVESISLNKWLSCTNVPTKAFIEMQAHKRGVAGGLENPYVHSQEAAMTRTKKKNPFVDLLKSD